MLNPYTVNPRLIDTVDKAVAMLQRFDADTAVLVANAQQAEEAMAATLDVLIQTHPDLKQDLDALAFGARVLGNIEGTRTASDRLKSEFVMALPYAIRKQLFPT